MAYDPIADESKEFTMREFEEELKNAMTEYVDALDQANDFTKGKHTFDEWMGHFKRYMSM